VRFAGCSTIALLHFCCAVLCCAVLCCAVRRANGVHFIVTGSHGLLGYCFVDLGDEFVVVDKDGEKIKEGAVVSISDEGVIEAEEHGLADGDTVVFVNVEGLTALNLAAVRIASSFSAVARWTDGKTVAVSLAVAALVHAADPREGHLSGLVPDRAAGERHEVHARRLLPRGEAAVHGAVQVLRRRPRSAGAHPQPHGLRAAGAAARTHARALVLCCGGGTAARAAQHGRGGRCARTCADAAGRCVCHC
jgi:hypothetical protein